MASCRARKGASGRTSGPLVLVRLSVTPARAAMPAIAPIAAMPIVIIIATVPTIGPAAVAPAIMPRMGDANAHGHHDRWSGRGGRDSRERQSTREACLFQSHGILL